MFSRKNVFSHYAPLFALGLRTRDNSLGLDNILVSLHDTDRDR